MSEDATPYDVLLAHTVRTVRPQLHAMLLRPRGSALARFMARHMPHEEMSLEEWTAAVDALVDDIEQREKYQE